MARDAQAEMPTRAHVHRKYTHHKYGGAAGETSFRSSPCRCAHPGLSILRFSFSQSTSRRARAGESSHHPCPCISHPLVLASPLRTGRKLPGKEPETTSLAIILKRTPRILKTALCYFRQRDFTARGLLRADYSPLEKVRREFRTRRRLDLEIHLRLRDAD